MPIKIPPFLPFKKINHWLEEKHKNRIFPFSNNREYLIYIKILLKFINLWIPWTCSTSKVHNFTCTYLFPLIGMGCNYLSHHSNIVYGEPRRSYDNVHIFNGTFVFFTCVRHGNINVFKYTK